LATTKTPFASFWSGLLRRTANRKRRDGKKKKRAGRREMAVRIHNEITSEKKKLDMPRKYRVLFP